MITISRGQPVKRGILNILKMPLNKKLAARPDLRRMYLKQEIFCCNGIHKVIFKPGIWLAYDMGRKRRAHTYCIWCWNFFPKLPEKEKIIFRCGEYFIVKHKMNDNVKFKPTGETNG